LICGQSGHQKKSLLSITSISTCAELFDPFGSMTVPAATVVVVKVMLQRAGD